MSTPTGGRPRHHTLVVLVENPAEGGMRATGAER